MREYKKLCTPDGSAVQLDSHLMVLQYGRWVSLLPMCPRSGISHKLGSHLLLSTLESVRETTAVEWFLFW